MIKRLFIAHLLLITAFPATCQEEQLVVNLSPSVNNRVFVFENPKGSIKVIGYNGNDIVVNAVMRYPGPEQAGGSTVRRFEPDPPEIAAETDGATVTLFSRTTGKTVDFDIKIPEKFSLRLKSLDNGNIQVFNIIGEIEVENANGDISLENVSGSSVLSSVYGNISAVFREVRTDFPMMFTSFEGDITLSLPASLNAVLKLNTETGEINTDFRMEPVKIQPVTKNIQNTRAPLPEDRVTGKINNGGPEYIIRSYSGNIVIKKQEIR